MRVPIIGDEAVGTTAGSVASLDVAGTLKLPVVPFGVGIVMEFAGNSVGVTGPEQPTVIMAITAPTSTITRKRRLRLKTDARDSGMTLSIQLTPQY